MTATEKPLPPPSAAEDKLREQLEEFALHMKPGTTKGKHRTAIFDTLELTKLVQALITQAQLDILNEIGEPLLTDMLPLPSPQEYDRQIEIVEWYENRLTTLRTKLEGK